jgi:glyoxylase I family protein
MIEGMEHIGLSVSDLERSIDFYCNHLGFKLVRIMEGSELVGKVVGMPGCKVRIAHLGLGPSVLELFHYADPVGDPIPTDRKQADKGFSHLGLRSADVRGMYSKLRDSGVKFISEPVEFRAGVWLCYFYGPDREVIEIRESERLLVEA